MDHAKEKREAAPPQYICGIAGGIGGAGFGDYNHPGVITQINVTYGAYINTVEVVWSDGTSIKHGGFGGDGPTAQSFFLNGEFLTGISGTLSTYNDGGPYVGSLEFTTHTGRSSEQFGTNYAGNTWDFNAPVAICVCDGQVTQIQFVIAGLCGRSGKYIDAIGVVLQSL